MGFSFSVTLCFTVTVFLLAVSFFGLMFSDWQLLLLLFGAGNEDGSEDRRVRGRSASNASRREPDEDL
jgi:hypothetical protein